MTEITILTRRIEDYERALEDHKKQIEALYAQLRSKNEELEAWRSKYAQLEQRLTEITILTRKNDDANS